MKTLNILFLTLIIFLSGCKNPLDESGTGKSLVDDAYNALLDLPSSFRFTNYDMQSSQVTLYWGKSERADSYQVKYGTSSGVYSTTASCSISPCTIMGLTNETTYYFTVIATNPKGSTSVGEELSITPINAPSVPSGVSGTSANGSVALSWSASTGTGTIKYRVLRSTASGSGYSQVATDLTTTNYTDTSVTNNTTYYYVVRSFNEFGEGTNSSEVIGTPMSAPSAPTGLSAASALSQVNLSWSAAVGSGTKTYTVYRSTTSGSGHTQLATNISALTYADTTASVGSTYYYYVTATNLGGTSSASSEVSGRVYQTLSLNIPFTATTESNYVFSNSSVSDFTGGVFRLTPSDQTDDDSASSGFGGATFTGAQYDSTNGYVRLNTTTNNAELDSSWTPQWGNLTGYWKLNGTGNINSGGIVNASVGTNGIEANSAGGTLAAYSTALFNQGIYFSTSNSRRINIGSGSEYDYGMTSFTVSYWVKFDIGTTNPQWSAGKGSAYNACGGGPVTGAGTGGWGIAHWTTSNPIIPNPIFSDGTNCIGMSGGAIYRGNWGHIALVINRALNTAYLYVNGTQTSTLSISSLGSISNLTGGYEYLSIGRGAAAPAQGLVMDEFAIWNSALTSSEIATIYARQSAKYSGLAQSRVMDGLATQSWTTLSSTTTLPFYKELPGAAGSESSTGYSSVGSNFDTNLILIHRFNETGSPIIFDNGNQLTGSPLSTCNSASSYCPTPTTNGRFAGALLFDGNDKVSTAKTGNQLDSYENANHTVSVWFKPTSTGTSQLMGTNGYHKGLVINADLTISFRHYLNDGSNAEIQATSTNFIKSNEWNHVLGILNRSSGTISIFLNGVSTQSSFTAGSAIHTCCGSYVNIGDFIDGAGGSGFTGFIDEVAIWSRDLSLSEVKELYRRGANRLKYQIRSCANSDCSDQEALTTTYKGWKGPDNTGLTYFSELYNTASNSPTGAVQTTNPVMTFSNFSGTGLSVTNNRYFQYRTILESDDQNNLCNYGSGATACSPELKSVTIGPNHYSTINAYVTSNVSIGSLFQTLNGFTSTLGVNSCTGDRYSISSDGTNFWYYNGSAWALSNGTYAQSSTASQINSNIGSLVAAMGVGTLQVRTYLNSDGVTPCEVDNVLIQGQKY